MSNTTTRERYCVMCGRIARRLLPWDDVREAALGPVYCSGTCAAMAALNWAWQHGYWWCDRCWQWHSTCCPCRHLHAPAVGAGRDQ